MSVSAMYSNRAAMINRSGNIVGYQSPPGKAWTEYVNNYDRVALSPDSMEREANEGLYGFLLPSEPDNLNLQSYSVWENGNLMDSYYPLSGPGSFLVIYAQVTDPSARVGKTTACWALEFATNTNWFPTEKPRVSSKIWSDSLEALKDIQQWYENPTHWKEIWQKVKSGAGKFIKGVENYGPKVIETASTIGSFLAAL